MANALNVKPTRMELSTLKDRLKVAQNGYDLLKDKQDELMRQFIELIQENNQLRNEVEDELSGALGNFVLASSSMNDAFMEEIVALPSKQVNLEIAKKNIMSVDVPKMSFSYDDDNQKSNNEVKYGYLNTSSELDDAIEVLNDVMPKLLKLSEIEKTCQLMATEIESTRRRVNALEYRMIPNIKETITNGRNGVMTPFGQVLGADGVKDVANYVRSMNGLAHDSVRAQRGKDAFANNCVACHGADAKGNPMLGAPDLTNNVWLYGSSEATIIETITHGRNNKMPAFGEFLGEDKVHILSAYVLSLSKK
ncbi:MAG: hypothetical protein B7Z25_01135 [Aerococcus viridans]|nr:MAG: hypothetical protein B7Z25_01135 [Aerococcus viridans]